MTLILIYPQPKWLIYVLKPPSKLKELFLPNVIISIISTYRRTKILEKILATSKGRKDSPLATDMRQHLRIVSNAIKPNVICAKKCPC